MDLRRRAGDGRRAIARYAAVGIAAALALAARAGELPAPAPPIGEWPQWGGSPCRNMVSGETGLPAAFVPGAFRGEERVWDGASSRNVKWVHRLGLHTYGSPVVAQGRVVVGTNWPDPALKFSPTNPHPAHCGGKLVCLDERSGELVWELFMPKMSNRRSPHGDAGYGLCAAAQIEGDRVYVVSNRNEVLCLDLRGMANGNDGPFLDEGKYLAGTDAREKPLPPVPVKPTDGDILWCYDMITELKVRPHDNPSSATLILGDFLYAATGNAINERENKVESPLAPSLIVLDKRTGRLAAQDEEAIGTRLYKGQWSSPALGIANGREMILYGAGDGRCYAFEPLREAQPGGVARLRCLWATDCNRGEYLRPGYERPEKWTKVRGPSEIIGTPVCWENRVYVTVGRDPARNRTEGALTCLDAATGARLWVWEGIGMSLSTVAIADGLLYAGETEGHVHCLDARTGRLLWTHKGRGEIWSSPFVADGKVYVATQKGLLIFAAGPCEKLLSTVVLDSATHCTPCAADGTLYVTSLRCLYAVQEAEQRKK